MAIRSVLGKMGRRSCSHYSGQRSQSSLGGFPVPQQCGAAGKMEISGSYISPYFITDQMSLTCDYKMPLIISFSGVIDNGECDLVENAIDIVEKAKSMAKPLLFVAKHVDDGILSMLISKNSKINVCAVASSTNLDELAVFTGGELVTKHSSFVHKCLAGQNE